MDPTALVARFSAVIINPILLLIFATGLLVFVYGIVEFMWGLSNETAKKEQGRLHMIWGLVGMFIMAAAYAILKIIANTLGVGLPH
jgi:uncharacterized membrane protein YidH (DUF202 family)